MLDGPATENPKASFTALATACEPHTRRESQYRDIKVAFLNLLLTCMRPVVISASSCRRAGRSGLLPSAIWTEGVSSSDAARLFSLFPSEPELTETSSHWRRVDKELGEVIKIRMEMESVAGATLRDSESVSEIQTR